MATQLRDCQPVCANLTSWVGYILAEQKSLVWVVRTAVITHMCCIYILAFPSGVLCAFVSPVPWNLNLDLNHFNHTIHRVTQRLPAFFGRHGILVLADNRKVLFVRMDIDLQSNPSFSRLLTTRGHAREWMMMMIRHHTLDGGVQGPEVR